MIHTTELITPSMAITYLNQNVNNRPLIQRHVDFLASEITKGNFLLNGDAIRFSKEGVLLDGQHRLNAIVQANTPIQTLVVRGLDSETFNTLDVGRKRLASEAIYLAGHKNAKALAAAARTLMVMRDHTNWKQYACAVQIPNSDLIDFIESNPTVEEAVSLMIAGNLKRIFTPAMLSAVYAIFLKVDREATYRFNDIMKNMNQPGSAPQALCQHFINKKINKKTVTKDYQLAMLQKYFEYFLMGKNVNQVKSVAKNYPHIEKLGEWWRIN